MKLKGYNDTRLSDFSGGMDTLNSPSEITDTSFVYLDNFTTDGNKLVTMKSSTFVGIDEGAFPVTGMTSYDGDVFFIQNGLLNAYNFTDLSHSVIGFNIGTANSTRYNMTAFYFGAIYVVICDSLGIENTRVYRFYDAGANWTFASHTITFGGTNNKFTTCKFNEGKLFLGGLPDAPSVMYYSKTGNLTTAVATPDAWIDFSAYNAGSQQVGDGTSPITAFAIRQDNFYICTKASIWKIVSTRDDGTTYDFQIKKETHTGVVGHYAICETQQDIFYFDGNAIRRLSYESNGNTFSVKDVKMSSKMDGYMSTLNPSQADAVMVFDYPLLHTYLRSNDNFGGISNDVAVIYNVKMEGWNISTSHSISTGCQYYLNGSGNRGVVGSSLKAYLYQLNTSLGYNSATAISKEYTTFDDVDFKRYVQLELTGSTTNGLTTYVDLYVDGRIVQTREITGGSLYTTTTGTATAGVSLSGGNGSPTGVTSNFIVRFEMFNDGRSFQYRIRKPDYGIFELHTSAFRWKPVNAYPMHY